MYYKLFILLFCFSLSARSNESDSATVYFIGDSLGTNFYLKPKVNLLGGIYISNLLSIFQINKEGEKGTSFFSDSSGNETSIYTFSDYLQNNSGKNIEFINAAEVGAKASTKEKSFMVNNLQNQVDELLELNDLPDLILLWMGHNDLDWVKNENYQRDLRSSEIANSLKVQVNRITKKYEVKYGEQASKKLAIVILGLVDFTSFFKARNMCEKLREKTGGFDSFYDVYDVYPSLEPEHRDDLVMLANAVNEKYKISATELSSNYNKYPNLRILYSDSLSQVDLVNCTYLNEVDAWHPSIKAQQGFSDALWMNLQDTFHFLGFSHNLQISKVK